MSKSISIALIGDHNPDVTAHTAIPKALALVADAEKIAIRETWIGTEELEQAVEKRLAGFDGVWCVPASPYRSMDGALNAIRFARENGRPFLGTCGGCQHALIEIARNVLGLSGADHEETNPQAQLLIIPRLRCALREATDKIILKNPSRLRTIYGWDEIVEGYNCSFGINAAHEKLIEQAGLRIVGRDAQGEIRAVELEAHPFFIGTLFQPERSALKGTAHPLIAAFARAAAKS
jgi:CTP synthase (UTP-ammonia lyase)